MKRKNSLFFGSGKMAGVSAAYHTIISTSKMQGVWSQKNNPTFDVI